MFSWSRSLLRIFHFRRVSLSVGDHRSKGQITSRYKSSQVVSSTKASAQLFASSRNEKISPCSTNWSVITFAWAMLEGRWGCMDSGFSLQRPSLSNHNLLPHLQP